MKQINTRTRVVPGLFLTLTLLSACATQGDIHPAAALKTPAALGAVPVPVAAEAAKPVPEYWKQLGDPQLDALIDQALADSPTLRLADARIRRAMALTDAANSATQPQVSAGLDVMDQRFTENGLVPPPVAGSWRTNNRLALDASINLDVWGKYRAGVEGAQAQRQMAEVEAKAARLALASSIARAWVEYDRLYQQRDKLDALIATRQELEKLQGIRVKAGLDAEFDRNQQQFSIAGLRTERAQLDERIALQRDLLVALAGKGQGEAAKLGRPALKPQLDARLPSTLPADLLGSRPDVLASRWRVEAAARDIDVARTQFYPDVNLTGFLGFSSLGLDKLINAQSEIIGVGPAVRLPIFEGGRLRANLAAKTADYDAAVEQYNATLVDALRDVVDQARSLEGAQQQDETAQQALSAAQHGVTLVDTRIRQRLSSRVQLLSAQLQVLAQERVMLDLHARRLDAALGLERALGGGFAPRNNPFTLAAQ